MPFFKMAFAAIFWCTIKTTENLEKMTGLIWEMKRGSSLLARRNDGLLGLDVRCRYEWFAEREITETEGVSQKSP